MANKYCKHCGHKNEYVGSSPKFCNNCGKPMSSLASKNINNKKPIKSRSQEIVNDDETEIDYVPSIAKLQYEISPFSKKSYKMEDLFNLEDDGEEKR